MHGLILRHRTNFGSGSACYTCKTIAHAHRGFVFVFRKTGVDERITARTHPIIYPNVLLNLVSRCLIFEEDVHNSVRACLCLLMNVCKKITTVVLSHFGLYGFCVCVGPPPPHTHKTKITEAENP
jgi:hypothetical protein